MIDLNKIASGALAGLFIGALVGGMGSRLAMRIVALLIGSPPSLTAGGVLGLLVMGGLLGLLGGFIFAIARPHLARLVPGPSWVVGLAYGVVLALMTALPFFLNRQGELGLLPPLQEAMLFAPIALLYGVLLARTEARLRARFGVSRPASVSLVWLGALGFSLILAFVSMSSLTGTSVHLPIAVVRVAREQGLSLDIRDLNTLLARLFAIGYCGLSTVVFWQGAHSQTARLTAILMLWFAAAFFNDGQVLPGAMRAFPLVRWLPVLVQALGLSGMMFLLFVFADGQLFPSWTRRLMMIYTLASLLGFAFVFGAANALPDSRKWTEPLVAALLAGGLLAGLTAQILRLRAANPKVRRQTAPVVAALTLAIFSLVVVWLAQAVLPDLRGRTLAAIPGLFAFAPYLLPWLLLPIAVVYAQLRRGLWKEAS